VYDVTCKFAGIYRVSVKWRHFTYYTNRRRRIKFKIQDSKCGERNYRENLTDRFLSQGLHLTKISRQFTHNFLSNSGHRQTD